MPDHVAALRAFNRMWTARIGVLASHLHDTPFSLTEARILFELAQQPSLEVATLRTDLGLDAGYLSRILARFKREHLVELAASPTDARRQRATLTKAGHRAFRTLDTRAAADVSTLLATLSDADRDRLLAAMRDIERVLAPPRAAPILLRPPRAGDLGWIVERHGALYAREYAWNDEFEALVARIVSDFVTKRDPRREAAWIAERDGERVGCILCVKKTTTTAQLRLLLVEPSARGHGIGRTLVDECIRFARDHGYRRIVLWTNSVLDSARRIYQAAGFTLAHAAKHHAFGHDLTEQTWRLALDRPAP
ncbi:MAG TPA: helix-turn-helix domain-containing GNAT family N-acetyltransferase [Kofleriaceae bacterium]|nr:helix-turn-helix domain-containing GNAT family N-acetyltransferase [Kofleriaceae bacterium]